MMEFAIPSIFITTIIATLLILTISTLIGRLWVVTLPYRLKTLASFYLSPALGLATLTVIASLLGRVSPLGNSVVVPFLVLVMLIVVFLREPRPHCFVGHALTVSLFGVICGVSLLAPLYIYGAFNAHNDAFTYLVHSHWLQSHAFGEVISSDKVTPLTTQVSLYQQEGFRMGATFLLAFWQAFLNLHSPYEIYPAVIISAMAACCLAIGFPLSGILSPLSRFMRLGLLSLPAFSLGGLVFGANLGFLPQTVGLSLGAVFLFTLGPLFNFLVKFECKNKVVIKIALPLTVLFVAATFSYSELSPFLVLSTLFTAIFLAFHFSAWKNLLVTCVVILVVSSLLLNSELVRIYAALRTQTGVVVGSPVDWTVLGFIAHAFGLHGGAWDGFQWGSPEKLWTQQFYIGLSLLFLVVLLPFSKAKLLWRNIISGVFMPAFVILIIFLFGFIYFRYFVPSPFPKGLGQSWSQFKLADWAHPFLMVFVLFAFSDGYQKAAKPCKMLVYGTFALTIVGSAFSGVSRVSSLMHYYEGVNDLNAFYRNFRETVLSTCPQSTPIYLDLRNENHKFRQMASLYLYDREVKSNWMDDGYIYPRLPEEKRTQRLEAGNCVVERIGQDSLLEHGKNVGPFVVGVFDGKGKVQVSSVIGTYERESSGRDWWYWVKKKVIFKLNPVFVSKAVLKTKLYFQYSTRGKQTLTVLIYKRDGSSQKILLQSNADILDQFDEFIDMPPNDIVELSIESNGTATPLGIHDSRVASWIIRNVAITPELR